VLKNKQIAKGLLKNKIALVLIFGLSDKSYCTAFAGIVFLYSK